MGATINARMGLNTWAAFVGSDQKAAVAGDVAMLEDEVTPVIKALRSHSLDVVAIHHLRPRRLPNKPHDSRSGYTPAALRVTPKDLNALNSSSSRKNASISMFLTGPLAVAVPHLRFGQQNLSGHYFAGCQCGSE
jgi:hypothetical protein